MKSLQLKCCSTRTRASSYGAAVVDMAGAPWTKAVRRAQDAALRAIVVPEDGRETSWDLAAVRGVIASGLYALSARDQVPAQQVPWDAVLWHLRDEPTLRRLVETTLPEFEHAALGPDPGPGADPAAHTWWWLNRTWHLPGAIPLG